MNRSFPLSFLAAALLVLAFCAAAGAPADTAPATSAVSDLDWYPRDQLSADQQLKMPAGCCGAYIEPAPASPPATEGDADSINLSGDSSEITRDSTRVSGSVRLLQGQRTLTGDQAELFNDPQSVHLEGHVTFREPGFLLRGDNATVDLENDSLDVDGAHYVLHEERVQGIARKIQRREDGTISFIDSTYSTCEPGDPLWQLRSQSMVLDVNQQQGTARHVRVEVADIPVFYFPYLRFPLSKQRQSGFLMPSIVSGEDGLDVSVPYYFNLAPNYDLMLTPRQIADRGTQLGGEFRHLSRHFESTMLTTYLPDDNQYNNDRWLIDARQTGGAQQPWSSHIDFTRVSDIDYFEDLSGSGLSVSQQTHLKQAAGAGYMTDHWDSSVEVETFQTLRNDSNMDDPYKKLPAFSFNGDYILDHGLSMQMDHEIARFDHNHNAQVTGDRFAAYYKLAWLTQTEQYFVEPAVAAHYRHQSFKENTTIDSADATAPEYQLNTGLFFERKDGDYLETLTPKISHLYTQYQNQDDFNIFDSDEIDFSYSQLYETRRLSGNDKIADNNATRLGFTYGISDLKSGREWMNFGFGQSIYHDDRKIIAYSDTQLPYIPAEYLEQYTESRSPYVASWNWYPDSQWEVDSQISWSDVTQSTRLGHTLLHYKNNGNIFTTGYRHSEVLTQLDTNSYILEVIREGIISGYWSINNQWAMMGGTRFDFSNQRSIENMFGFQFEDCCWRVRTLYRAWETNPDEVFNTDQHERNQGIYFEFYFKGLGSTGNKISTLLEDGIYGY